MLAEPAAIPRHHALRFEFENQAQFPAFPKHPSRRCASRLRSPRKTSSPSPVVTSGATPSARD
jgi:hypothetical protein